MKFWKNMAICSAALLLLGGCGTKTLRMNIGAPEGTVWGVAADTFARAVEADTGGRWRVEIAYGDTARGLERLLDGKAGAELCAVSDLTALEERLSALSLPWLFSDAQDVDRRLLHGPGGEAVRNLIRATTLEPLALGENGFRQVTNDRRPVSAPADFRSLTIRVRDDDMESALFAGFGAEPVRMDWADTFPALRDGDVAGQQNTLESIRLAQVDRVQRYLTVWNCAYDPLCLCVSAELWAKLSDEDKEIFYAAAREAADAEITASRARDAETLREFRKSGVEVTTLTASQIQAFRTASEGVYNTWRDAHGDELLAALGYSG